MDREEIKSAILETLKDREGAGSDLEIWPEGGEWWGVEGNLDIEHLVSDIESLIQSAVEEALDAHEEVNHLRYTR